jgi:hypothetical protein
MNHTVKNEEFLQRSLTSILKYNSHSIALANNDIVRIEHESYNETHLYHGTASECSYQQVGGCSLIVNAGSQNLSSQFSKYGKPNQAYFPLY